MKGILILEKLLQSEKIPRASEKYPDIIKKSTKSKKPLNQKTLKPSFYSSHPLLYLRDQDLGFCDISTKNHPNPSLPKYTIATIIYDLRFQLFELSAHPPSQSPTNPYKP